MTRSVSRTPAVQALLAAISIAALVAACSPTAGPLGAPTTPNPSSEPSVELPSDDATPDLSSPSAQPSVTPGTSGVPAASPTSPATPTATPSPTATPDGSTIVRAYYIMGSFTGNEGLVPVLRVVPETQAVATAAMRALLGGPQGDELAGRPAMFTAIPDGTRLLGLSISNGIATVDLSREFETGGGSASILGRLAQVVYTLTQFSTVDSVRFQLDGVPVTVFSGEGVILDQPVDREDYRDQLPAIFVDRPAWGASLGNPGVVTGVANVFEAAFIVELRSESTGEVLATQPVMASCGTGCWGTFKATLSYTVATAQWGTLRVFDLSAKDGAIENLSEYRVWLTPVR